MPKKQTFLLSLHIPELEEILIWVRELLSPHSISSKELKEFELSIEEAVVNVAEHAYRGEGGSVEICFEEEPNGFLTFIIKDQGPFFNPVVHAEKIKTENLMGKDEGGLGVYLMCAAMDAVHYKREGDYNVLTLKKKLK